MASAFLFPIALFGFHSAYQDFFSAMMLSAGLIALSTALHHWYVQQSSKEAFLIAAPCLLAASLTKYQGLIQAILAWLVGVGFIAIFLLLKRNRAEKTLAQQASLKAVLLWMLIIGGLLLVHPLGNLIHHGNPLYPIAAGPFPGPEATYSASQEYTAFLGPLKPLANHLTSTTELDWIARGVVPSYTIDQARSQIQYGGLLDPREMRTLIRSGGSFGPIYFVVIGLFSISACQAWRNASGSGGQISPQGFLVLALAPYLLLSGFLPQSHELRYYIAQLVLPAYASIAWLASGSSRMRWLACSILTGLVISFTLNFIYPLVITAHEHDRTGTFSFAATYPVRFLPTLKDCLADKQKPASPMTYDDPGQAFACRMILPARIMVKQK
ncbi:hypothetical protein H6G65_02145 [Microcystis elabens FACHB-917]|nr:hypothetical protein [Microcystis elabens FACHB-917]